MTGPVSDSETGPTPPGTRCSAGSAAADEQLAGSAPEAAAWVALEQNGPWGARAFTASHLDPATGREIERLAAAHRTRPVLVRRPGRHADEEVRHGDPRTVLVAWTHPGESWLLEGLLSGPTELLHLDWPALAVGDRDAVRASLPSLVPSHRPHLLVCTNGSRDLCCAAVGRPVARGVAAHEPDRTWESTHTSGHRFAPTTVLLPTGELHGRLDVAAATQLVRRADAGHTVLTGSRGRSTWSPPAQVAELAVRRLVGETRSAALRVSEHRGAGQDAWRTVVEHVDGRRWAVRVRSTPTDVERAESCGKQAVPMRRWETHVRTVG